jgi:hypothetical protein
MRGEQMRGQVLDDPSPFDVALRRAGISLVVARRRVLLLESHSGMKLSLNNGTIPMESWKSMMESRLTYELTPSLTEIDMSSSRSPWKCVRLTPSSLRQRVRCARQSARSANAAWPEPTHSSHEWWKPVFVVTSTEKFEERRGGTAAVAAWKIITTLGDTKGIWRGEGVRL